MPPGSLSVSLLPLLLRLLAGADLVAVTHVALELHEALDPDGRLCLLALRLVAHREAGVCARTALVAVPEVRPHRAPGDPDRPVGVLPGLRAVADRDLASVLL